MYTYNTVYYEDGWLEISAEENADAWIATSSPSEVVP
ncbi:hypothetical protein SAMN05216278_0360 [Halopelagius longus]|uniref:Uncharacterized protein n=1 Tax=Halopelagius longus TaxID=1236180 RepID=A0A1H0Y2H8_9EURY|nr:hypothetical protein SAMN05216278_0360 [Halopelagius longus]